MSLMESSRDGSAGHKSGRQIVELLKKKEADWTEDDYTHVKHVSAYCKRHTKQGNTKDPEHSKWRYSLMNWYEAVMRSCESCQGPGTLVCCQV